MKISKISFFNIGSSFHGGQDYYDAIKPDGLIILYSDECYFLGFYNNNNQSVDIKKMNYDAEWWKIAADHLISKHKFDTSQSFLSGLLQCADQQDQDGLYDHCQSEGGEVIFDSPSEPVNEEAGIFCINQYIEGEFEYMENKIKISKDSIEIKDLFGSLDDLSSSLVYLNK
jgi:hypothetical protein